MEGEAAEEDGHHRCPVEVLPKGTEKGLLTRAVAEDGERDVADEVEDDDQGHEDFPGRHVKVIDAVDEPADEDVVHQAEGEAGANGEVRADVGRDANL